MGQVPTTNLLALYANTTPGVTISSTTLDAAVVDIVATVNSNDTAFGVLAAAGGIGTTNLAALSVTTAKIALLAVTAAQLADSAVTSAKILDGTIATGDLADLAITTAKLALLSVTVAQIADATITGAKMALLAIGTAQLADSAVTSAKIADGTIVDADINASAAIAGSKLADGGITSAKIADNTIVDADVNASAAIAWSKISKASSNLTDLATRLITDLTGVLAAAQFPALTGDLTTVAGALATTLKSTGTAGTYKSVTTDAQGRITAGTNPSTLLGYGITDAAPLTHVGSGGASQHPVVTALVEGFMSIADKTKLDGLVQTGLAGYTVPVDTYITFGSRFKVGYNSTTDTLDTYET